MSAQGDPEGRRLFEESQQPGLRWGEQPTGRPHVGPGERGVGTDPGRGVEGRPPEQQVGVRQEQGRAVPGLQPPVGIEQLIHGLPARVAPPIDGDRRPQRLGRVPGPSGLP